MYSVARRLKKKNFAQMGLAPQAVFVFIAEACDVTANWN